MSGAKGKRSRRERWGERAAGLGLQLLVVFVGVYAAFLLENYREERKAERLNEQLYTLLIGEVESVAFGLDQQRRSFDSLYVAPIMDTTGARTPLRPYYDVKGDLHSPELQALLESGQLGADRPELLPAIRRYNASLNYIVKLSDELRTYSIAHLAPVGQQEAEVFYNEAGFPRSRYRPYGPLVFQLRMSMVEAVEAAERLRALLGTAQE